MNDAIKLSLSADELELVCNKDWILTKKMVVDKVYLLLGGLSQQMQDYIESNQLLLPAVVTLGSIYRSSWACRLSTMDINQCYSSVALVYS